ncbi:MAG: PhoH family protein [Bacteroidales bacterium]|nr:PhoH family protein [Bacteroidales bacterium]
MSEKILYLEGIDPVDIYGVNNTKIELIKSFFSKLKIITRGNEIKAIGEEIEIDKFEKKFFKILAHFEKYNSLSERDIKNIIDKTTKNGIENDNNTLLYGKNGKIIKARSENQQLLVDHSRINDLIFVVGPAGSGKTYIAIALAVQALKNKEVKRIILSKPAVEAGEHLGFLPGEIKEKLDPYIQPLYDALYDMLPSKKIEDYFENGTIQIAPLAFMRGRTLNNAFVILDEAQNATVNQLKMFLTRMGNGSKFVVNGDITQIDLPNRQSSGLLQAIKILINIDGISIIHFDKTDIVRHKLVKHIVEAYNNITENKENAD